MCGRVLLTASGRAGPEQDDGGSSDQDALADPRSGASTSSAGRSSCCSSRSGFLGDRTVGGLGEPPHKLDPSRNVEDTGFPDATRSGAPLLARAGPRSYRDETNRRLGTRRLFLCFTGGVAHDSNTTRRACVAGLLAAMVLVITAAACGETTTTRPTPRRRRTRRHRAKRPARRRPKRRARPRRSRRTRRPRARPRPSRSRTTPRRGARSRGWSSSRWPAWTRS